MSAEHEEHVSALHTYVTRLLGGDRHRAEDIVQEALFRCWRSFGATAGAQLRPWLFTVARNLVVDAHRSRKARPREVDGTAWLDQGSTDLDETEPLLTSVVVVQAMKTLSVPHREALYVTYFLGNTFQQASRILGIPVGTTKSRVHYGLRALRTALARRGVQVQVPRLPAGT
ncbi:sigma-70 family RNA polymerase sigma factor [Streptomyces thermoviolaceus]|uniref:Sigma-70 family RNA polymerase sigma factor n=1 Tax=Streptomyces thermoviolaceus subsp. thermoviolaceus TaxID=66860 RepID=A0ABX0YPW6_STRTL|nr:sigma-70 family RNA polymerase sigma factor [Streptomyces thermoviolaceus]NJP14533.1 sigma-70 family RNA polymerase sigma factor [Streptomyces thermoviolaceus subsp. thermoviolaceus]WTD47918.1 sigma-70 family RNA polymerase sigma factor [Streptomyces thermoviolaceus]